MKNLVIARRYAKALMLIGKEDNKAESYRDELSAFSGLMAANRGLEQAICNPLYDAGSRRNVLLDIIGRMDLSAVVKSFLLLLFDKGRVRFIGHINEFYHQLVDEWQGVTRASLVSATELTSDTIKRIRDSLSRRVGKEIIVETELDPGLIGGVVTRIGDLVLDGSVRTQLRNMKESLKRGERG